MTFFRWGEGDGGRLQLLHGNRKNQKFIDKCSFYDIIKNLKLRILSKNELLLKYGMWIEDKILWGFTEKSDFRRGVMKKPIYRGDCLKRGIGQFVDLKVGLAKKRGWCF